MGGRTSIVEHTSLIKLQRVRTTVTEVQQAYCWEHNYMRALDVATQREAEALLKFVLCSVLFFTHAQWQNVLTHTHAQL